MIRFTVITICKDERNTIKKTVESVLSQTYKKITYIVQDGASTDGTLDFLQNLSDERVCVCSEHDSGIYNAMNRAATKANGDYVLFLNAGDILVDENVLERVAERLEGQSNPTIFYGKTVMQEGEKTIGIQDFTGLKGKTVEKLFRGEMPCHQGMFAPLKALKSHYFNEEYTIRADYEWLFWCLADGYQLVELPMIICNYDASGVSSKISSWKKMYMEEKQIKQRYMSFFSTEITTDFMQKEKDDVVFALRKYMSLLKMMEDWMTISQSGRTITEWLIKNAYQRPFIYGYGKAGKLLYNEFVHSGISVAGIYDRNQKEEDIPLYFKHFEKMRDISTDVVIVTPVFYFEDIKENLEGCTTCRIVSLMDIIMDIGRDNA